MKRLYEKNQILFAGLWIAAYCVLMSVGDALSLLIGVEKSMTLPIGALLSFVLLFFLQKNGLLRSFGLCRSSTSARSMLYYLPLLFLLSANFWHGATVNFGALETILYILSMFCVGFLEEVIFRGLLFSAMRKDNFKTAVIVSSITFGIGHIINLVNGSGAELVPNLLQVMYATAAGFMFVMIYCKTDSLIGCILVHAIFNACSAFANERNATLRMRVLSAVLLTAISFGYALYLALSMRNCDAERG